MSNSFFNFYCEEELEKARSMLQKDRGSGPLKRLKYELLGNPGRELAVHSMWEGVEGMMEHIQCSFPMPGMVSDKPRSSDSGKLNSPQEIWNIEASEPKEDERSTVSVTEESDLVSALIDNERDLSSGPLPIQSGHSKKRKSTESGDLPLSGSDSKACPKAEPEKHTEREIAVSDILSAVIYSESNNASLQSETECPKKTRLSQQPVDETCLSHVTVVDESATSLSQDPSGKECDESNSSKPKRKTVSECAVKRENEREANYVKKINDLNDELSKEEWFWIRLTHIKAEIKSVRLELRKATMKMKDSQHKQAGCSLMNDCYKKIKDIKHSVDIAKAEHKKNNFSPVCVKFTPEMKGRLRLCISCRPASRVPHIESILKQLENLFRDKIRRVRTQIEENKATFPTLHQLWVKLNEDRRRTGPVPLLEATDVQHENQESSQVDEAMLPSHQAETMAGRDNELRNEMDRECGTGEVQFVASPRERNTTTPPTHITHTVECSSREKGFSAEDLFWIKLLDLKDDVLATYMRMRKINQLIKFRKGVKESSKPSVETAFEQLVQVRDRIILLFNQLNKLKMEMTQNKYPHRRGLAGTKEIQLVCKIKFAYETNSIEIVETMLTGLKKNYTKMQLQKKSLLEKFNLLASPDQLQLDFATNTDVKRKVVRVCAHLVLKKENIQGQLKPRRKRSRAKALAAPQLNSDLNQDKTESIPAKRVSGSVEHENFSTVPGTSHDRALCSNVDPKPDIASSPNETTVINCLPEFSEKEISHWDRLQELYNTTQACNGRLKKLKRSLKRRKSGQFECARREIDQSLLKDLRTKLSGISRKFEMEENESNAAGYCKNVAYRHTDDGTKISSPEYIKSLRELKHVITAGNNKIQKLVKKMKFSSLQGQLEPKQASLSESSELLSQG